MTRLLLLLGLSAAGAVAAWAQTGPTRPDAGVAAAANPARDGGAPAPLSPRVRVVLHTVPPMKARVTWGGKPLGWIKGKGKPLIVDRPRDSGPMDVVIRAEGHVPVRTRAHTFNDHKMFVKITPVAEKQTLFGYRQAVPDAGAPDGGAPAALGAPAVVGPPAPGATSGAGGPVFGPHPPGPAPDGGGAR